MCITPHKMKFSIIDFFNFLQIWSHFLKKSIMENFIFCAVYIVAKGKISVEGTDNSSKRNKNLTFKNIAPFRSCISKINNTFADNAEDLYIVMLIYNLLEYSENYSMTSGSFWDFYRDGVIDNSIENNEAGDHRINNNKTTASKSFEYKKK